MKKLQKEFETFDKLIRIDGEATALRSKRDMLKADIEKYFPEECSQCGIEVNKSDLRFIHQGSYKIGTTISNPDGTVDLDYAVVVPLDIGVHADPRQIKKAARDALMISKVRVPTIKEPCVTVAYHENGNEYMHIDFPLYAESGTQLYLARGKEFSEKYGWEMADPDGLNDYFLDSFSINSQIRRIVRYIKKWKQEKYRGSASSYEVPPSIGLTLLVCENYAEYTFDSDDDLSSLYYTMKAIRDRFVVLTDFGGNISSASITCLLPVTPYSDVFYKMRNSASHMVTFYKRVCTAVDNLQQAINLSDEHEAAKYVQKVLGDDFTVPEKNAVAASTQNKREYSFG